MLPILRLHDDGSVTIITTDTVSHSASVALAHAYLWTHNYRMYWSEEFAGQQLCSTLIVLEDVQSWFIASTLRTRSSIRKRVLYVYRWCKERVALRRAVQRAQYRQAQRDRERQIRVCLDRCLADI